MNQKLVNLRAANIAFTPQNLSLAEGVRAGIAVAATLLAGNFLHLPDFGLAALGALLTCFADPGGPLQRRAPAVIAFALFSGVYFGIFGYLSGINVVVAAGLADAAIFGNAYARVYGQGGLQVGNLLSVATVIAIGNPAHSAADAAAQGLNFCAGAAWAATLTLAIWRLHPYQPARLALAGVSTALAALAKDLARLAAAEDSVAAFEAHAATHRRAVREAIEAARTIAMEIFRARGLATRRGAQTTLRLNTLEQIFGRLIALSDSLEEADILTRARAGAPLRRIAGWLAALGPDMVADRPLERPKKQASWQRLRDAAAPLDESLRRHFDGIAENFAVLLTISGTEHAATPAPEQPGLRTRILSPLRANWSFRHAAAMRHALRAACIATPTLILSVMYGGPFAHWATITMVLCLNPYFSATWTRTAERVAGTALGGVAAGLIGIFAHTRTELAVVMLPLTMFAFSIRAVSYGLFVAALTPMIVLLIEQIAPGADETVVAAARVGYTLLGGGLAVAGNLLLWPDFESGRLESSVAAAVAAHAAFIEAVFRTILEGAPPPDAQRRAAGLASNNLEAAISRALLEPHGGADAGLQRAALTDAALRRLAGRLSGLALERPAIPPADVAHWCAWKDWLIAALSTHQPAPRPPLPAHPAGAAFTRLARQVELLGS